MNIVVIDAQGGGIGRSIIERIKAQRSDLFIIAVGTNALATSNMLKGGADVGATGENAVIHNASKAQVIIGPIGICFANAMYGEISPAMASAISSSEAMKYLIPNSRLNVYIPGSSNLTLSDCMNDIVTALLNNL